MSFTELEPRMHSEASRLCCGKVTSASVVQSRTAESSPAVTTSPEGETATAVTAPP
eukprot:CAMPEP_0170643630 /NCGR_PEP_ID=MMETSP0224-20130122/42000_1 /TAXON_ID=285029 /ORGANISM="Togula jolla, Strain CCCM 725" /LENGTH=55 /DNA_ID=CAMNT_0010974495 /DNA_START=77 /DNA_END=244 /DNA_ORIENTATION=-